MMSLGATLDTVSDALFFGRLIPVSQRARWAREIAARQGLPGAYADLFAPTDKDQSGIRLFTGERIRTRAGIAHTLGEEALRVLRLLNANTRQVHATIDRAVQGIATRVEEAEQRGGIPGLYCCGACSAAYWRNLASDLLPRSEERLRSGLAQLAQLRDGRSRWRRFPFFYTCLVLTEIGPRLAGPEMEYAAPYWRKNLQRLARARDGMSKRRMAVGLRLLEMSELTT